MLTSYSSLEQALDQEVVHYDFTNSMFDMVVSIRFLRFMSIFVYLYIANSFIPQVVAFWRLVVLELAYGIFKWQKPWAAGVSFPPNFFIEITRNDSLNLNQDIHLLFHENTLVYEYCSRI